MKFFSYDRFGDFELHDTAEAAKRSAEESLTAERETASQCGEGWPDEVTEICWGELREKALEQDRRPVDSSDPQGAAYVVDYALQPVGAPVTADGLELAITCEAVCESARLSDAELQQLTPEHLRAAVLALRVSLAAAARFIRGQNATDYASLARGQDFSTSRNPLTRGAQAG